jgi:serine/threonine protein phosphatase PrpC
MLMMMMMTIMRRLWPFINKSTTLPWLSKQQRRLGMRIVRFVTTAAFYVACRLLTTTRALRHLETPLPTSLQSLLHADNVTGVQHYLKERGFAWPVIRAYLQESPTQAMLDGIIAQYVRSHLRPEMQTLLKDSGTWRIRLQSAFKGGRLNEQLHSGSRSVRDSSASISSFGTAAYGTSKQESSPVKLTSEVSTFGEDSIGLAQQHRPLALTFAVADGVGGAPNSHVVSRALVKASLDYLVIPSNDIDDSNVGTREATLQDAVEWHLLTLSLELMLRRLQHPGSSTLTFGAILDGTLHVAHVGDCQLQVYSPVPNSPSKHDGNGTLSSGSQKRQYELAFETKEQWLMPNMPNQLQALHGIQPDSIALHRLAVRPGDLVIITSDGVMDNVWPAELLDILSTYGGNSLDELARMIVARAIENGMGRRGADIPFNAKIQEAVERQPPGFLGGLQWRDVLVPGKRDDTSCIVIQVH